MTLAVAAEPRRRPRCVKCAEREQHPGLWLCLTCHDDPETKEQVRAAEMTFSDPATQRLFLVTTFRWAGGRGWPRPYAAAPAA